MTKEELSALADKHQEKADKAYQNYQATGASRYDRERYKNEDLADALRMAAYAADDHMALVSLRCDIAGVVRKAKEALAWKGEGQEQRDAAIEKALRELLAVASVHKIVTEVDG